MKIYSYSIGFLLLLLVLSSFTCRQKEPFSTKTFHWDTIKKDTVLVDSILLETNTTSIIDSAVIVPLYKEKAHASYYHDKFNGKKTASGIPFDNAKFTAAHKKLPFGTQVKVTNIANGKSVVVTITDRGPYSKGREIDLSKAAFKSIARNNDVGVMLVNLQITDE